MKSLRTLSVFLTAVLFVDQGFQSVVSISSESPSGNNSQIITPAFVQYIEELMRNNSIPGLALAVVDSNGKAELGAWGNRTEDGDPMTSDTLLDLASCSKAFLSASMGILIDDYAHGRNSTPLPPGVRLDWDTKIVDLLPGQWELMDEWATRKANLKDVLSHVSGLPRHDYSYAPLDTAEDILQRLRYLRPAFELRERFSYNNQMYMVGAYIISTYTGSFSKFVEDRIFKPLNMTSTTYSTAAANSTGRLTQTWTDSGRRIPYWFNDSESAILDGPGGVISSARDLTKWVGTLLNAGVDPTTNVTIIPRSAFDEVTSANVIISGNTSDPASSILGYGMGWERYSLAGHDVFQHDGSVPGISTLVTIQPWDNIASVILTNADNKYLQNLEIAQTIGASSSIGNTVAVSAGVRRPSVRSAAILRSRAEDSAPPLANLAGTYSNGGYGSPITLCDTSSTSQYCAQTLAAFHIVDTYAAAEDNGSELYATWPRAWSSHVRLTHLEGNQFTALPTTLYPNGYGRNTTPFEEISGTGLVEFVVEGGKVAGFSLRESVGEETNREKKGGSVEETADAWFIRE